jgi:hypothetical protein
MHCFLQLHKKRTPWLLQSRKDFNANVAYERIARVFAVCSRHSPFCVIRVRFAPQNQDPVNELGYSHKHQGSRCKLAFCKRTVDSDGLQWLALPNKIIWYAA